MRPPAPSSGCCAHADPNRWLNCCAQPVARLGWTKHLGHRTVAQRPVCRPADFEHACAKLGATDCTTLAALLHGDRSGCVPSHAQSE